MALVPLLQRLDWHYWGQIGDGSLYDGRVGDEANWVELVEDRPEVVP